MAFLIPDNLKSRAVVPAVMQRVARALQMSLDDDAIVSKFVGTQPAAPRTAPTPLTRSGPPP